MNPPDSQKPPRNGCYVLLTRFNHSCVPNCRISSAVAGPSDADASALASVATRTIHVGEELTFCYQNKELDAMTRRERHRVLPFACTCHVCSGTASQRLCSDLRRRLFRGMVYLIQGYDMNATTKQSPGLPLIIDPALKLRAERSQHTASSTFVYIALLLAVMEAEGIWGHFQLEGLSTLLPYLETPARRAIASRALEQSTAAECFFFAAGLYK
ncbi:hypothetical protein NQ176_g3132 [Zarea fungicola]|uniref:Uncharacterized protein n=1 Tax=Zarea fungicola TaxID=93591 RepID=A0ACC1NLE5_9HYPO|nr:hypothetical protein NQ176_g3132 [Lecanicillium fungicola]